MRLLPLPLFPLPLLPLWLLLLRGYISIQQNKAQGGLAVPKKGAGLEGAALASSASPNS